MYVVFGSDTVCLMLQRYVPSTSISMPVSARLTIPLTRSQALRFLKRVVGPGKCPSQAK